MDDLVFSAILSDTVFPTHWSVLTRSLALKASLFGSPAPGSLSFSRLRSFKVFSKSEIDFRFPFLSLLFSAFAVLICLVYVHLPFMVLPLYANLEKHEQALLDAAQDLGANAWQRFWRITFPLSLPGVYAGAALVFIPALGIFQVRKRPARMGRNPATGEAIKIKASKKIAFRPAKELKESV